MSHRFFRDQIRTGVCHDESVKDIFNRFDHIGGCGGDSDDPFGFKPGPDRQECSLEFGIGSLGDESDSE